MAKAKSGAELRREQIRAQFFSTDDLWTGDKEIGWFPIPRTLPLILGLIDSKTISQGQNASLVYLELLSRMRGDGVIEMASELEHAFAAGYEGPRALRSWHERMKTLEENGFIRVQKAGNEAYKYVALIHPTAVVQKLRDEGKVSETWWNAYFARKLDTKELTQDQRLQKQAEAAAAAAKVVTFPVSAAVPVSPPVAPVMPQPVAAVPPLATTGTGQG
jgi:hypothetical protein